MTVGILGGGLAGLAVASHLTLDAEVLERAERCGGHCRSVDEAGFTWDEGGPHIIFSRNQRMVDYMVSLLAPNVRRGRRNNKILYKGRFVKYPFENGLYDLEPQDRYECLYSYLKNDAPPPTNFKEWLYYTFGRGLTEKYLLPYNEKIWNVPAEELGLEWVEGRVPKPPLEDVIKAAVGLETEGYTHQLHFFYPDRGGIESVPRALLERTRKVTTGFAVRRVSRAGDGWIVSDGHEERRYRRLVSTIPIQDLVAALEDVPATVLAAARGLRYNSLINVAVGVADDPLPDYTAVYVPDPRVRFHRISFPGVFSPRNVPAGRSMVVAEITANAGDGTWELDDAAVLADVVNDLDTLGIVRKARVCYGRVARTTYGYVVQDRSYRTNVELLKRYVDGLGITLCGRLAEFEYINMDVCIERGMTVARRLDEA